VLINSEQSHRKVLIKFAQGYNK